MEKITTHQYLSQYPINPACTRLILGTIHPHEHEEFAVPFFYGNVLSMWKILGDAFPGEMPEPITKEGVLRFLERRNITISDTVKVCKRTSNAALDEDFVPLELNKELVAQIRDSAMTEILFTSGFGRNNAFRLFWCEILKKQITPEIRKNRGVVLDPSVFGREVKLTVLFSPSGSANTGISRSAEYRAVQHLFAASPTPVKDFRIAYYREKFGGAPIV